MTKRINLYFITGLLAMSFCFSCEEEYEPATITFYPTLEAKATEPTEGADGTPITISLLTSRRLIEESQVNIRITGEGAGYGYSYVTNPPMLQPGILTLTIPEGEGGTSFTFTPKNDGLFIPDNYKYQLTIEQTSNSIKSIGQEIFTIDVKDETTPFVSFDFNDCGSSPVGFQEAIAGPSAMQANTWGCSNFGYPNETTKCAEANAYGKGGSTPSNSYLIMNTPVNGANYSKLHLGALVYSRHQGQGTIKFRYSSNYSGIGSPEAEGVVWTDLGEINNNLPIAGSQKWVSVGELIKDVPNSNIYFAIQFVGGTSGSSSSWRIENFELKGI